MKKKSGVLKKLSIIFPTFNEEKNPFFWKSLELCCSLDSIEIWVCDGGSSDQTLKRLSPYCSQFSFLKVLLCKRKNRSQQLQMGFSHSTGKLILLHHPRSLLSLEGMRYLLDYGQNLTWGGFTHQFDDPHPLLKFTSWYSNQIRAQKKGIIYLDHCLYFRRNLVRQDHFFPHVEIFEDTLISLYLRKEIGKPQILPTLSLTSSVRFKKNGIFYQSLLNQILKLAFIFHFSDQTMNRIYEKGLNLNSRKKSH